MQVISTRINIANLRNVLNAVESLQEAGETEKAEDCLRAIARNITGQLPPEPPGGAA